MVEGMDVAIGERAPCHGVARRMAINSAACNEWHYVRFWMGGRVRDSLSLHLLVSSPPSSAVIVTGLQTH